jgi:PiT family inorganic phosphate transporter
MSSSARAAPPSEAPARPNPGHVTHIRAAIVFLALLGGGLLYAAHGIARDVAASGATTSVPYLLLGVALVIALGFEFVNGLHDTANAVATVVYTHSLPVHVALPWSILCNLGGVLWSSGLVAFGIMSLLPVDLILQLDSSAGFAMIFALLTAAIIWNFGTWWLGLPASSLHTMVGSVVGIGVANALLHGWGGTSGVDWGEATKIGYALLLSPIVGFACSAVLIMLTKALVRRPELHSQPAPGSRPALWVRVLLVLTCTGVSFAHGTNDGQKGMGLIMLILIGTLPTTYALDRALPQSDVEAFVRVSDQALTIVESKVVGYADNSTIEAGMGRLRSFVRDRSSFSDGTYLSLATIMRDIGDRVKSYGMPGKIPSKLVNNTRREMYLVSEVLRFLPTVQDIDLGNKEVATLKAYRNWLDQATKFIPPWVRIVVAMALGLGALVGWKRIVVTVGDKIGRQQLTYGQGASAQLVAMGTILAADRFGLPVSTTHVLASGIAGTMAMSGSDIRLSRIRHFVLVRALGLPAAMLLSGSLYSIFQAIF